MDFSKIIEFASNIFKRKAEEYLNSIDSANNIDIPLKYSDFPAYSGSIKIAPQETVTDKYSRITIFYKGSPKKEYYDLLNIMGYVQGSDVRFDKENTYVIVEKIRNMTKIAYHIKN
jgi:hypothetical protein